jgi:putative membrane protein
MRRIPLTAGLTAGLAAAALLPAASASAKAYSPMDESWLTAAISGDRFEIAAGVLAEQRAVSATTRSAATRIVADHRRSLRQDARLARRLGIDVPKAPTPTQQYTLDTWANTSGGLFDHRYVTGEIQDHHQDIREVKPEIHEGFNQRVVHQGRVDLKVYKRHLALLESVRRAGQQ